MGPLSLNPSYRLEPALDLAFDFFFPFPFLLPRPPPPPPLAMASRSAEWSLPDNDLANSFIQMGTMARAPAAFLERALAIFFMALREAGKEERTDSQLGLLSAYSTTLVCALTDALRGRERKSESSPKVEPLLDENVRPS